MHQIIIAKPYEFVPPVRSPVWSRLIGLLLRPHIKRAYGMEQIRFERTEILTQALAAGTRVVLAPNHCRPSDPAIIAELARSVGTPVYIMASWHLFMNGALQRWVLRRIGAFSVYREGLDRRAIKEAVELLAAGERPLVIFPEGIITRGNDRLGMLNDGLAFIARTAAKQLKKEGNGGRVAVIPIAIRYRFEGELLKSIGPVIDSIEQRLTWQPRPEVPIQDRLYRIGQALVALKELEVLGEIRQGTLADRLSHLITAILEPLEQEWKVKVRDLDVPLRVRTLRAAILPEMIESEMPEAERARRWAQFERLYLAQQLSLYPAGYLDEGAGADRILETVERLEEDLTDRATIHRPMRATVTVCEPVDLREGEANPADVMKEVRARIEETLARTVPASMPPGGSLVRQTSGGEESRLTSDGLAGGTRGVDER